MMFEMTFENGMTLAVKRFVFCREVRGHMKERFAMRIILSYLDEACPQKLKNLLRLMLAFIRRRRRRG